jgi:hypothetical protein
VRKRELELIPLCLLEWDPVNQTHRLVLETILVIVLERDASFTFVYYPALVEGVGDTVLLHNLGWPLTCDPLVSALHILGLQTWTTMPGHLPALELITGFVNISRLESKFCSYY